MMEKFTTDQIASYNYNIGKNGFLDNLLRCFMKRLALIRADQQPMKTVFVGASAVTDIIHRNYCTYSKIDVLDRLQFPDHVK